MTKFIHKIGGMVAGVAFGALAFTSCSEQIDESNLYTSPVKPSPTTCEAIPPFRISQR